MIHEDSTVRVKGTDIIGTVIDFEPGTDVCMVDPFFTSDHTQPSDPFELKLSDIDELVEVDGSERREICGSFDLIRLTANYALAFGGFDTLTIKRLESGFLLRVSALLQKDPAEIVLEGKDATRLLSEIGMLKAFHWIVPFEPKGYLVLDGYGWEMEFYDGCRYFSCTGNNVTPQELLDFNDYIISLGLPGLEALSG